MNEGQQELYSMSAQGQSRKPLMLARASRIAAARCVAAQAAE